MVDPLYRDHDIDDGGGVWPGGDCCWLVLFLVVTLFLGIRDEKMEGGDVLMIWQQ